MLVKKDPDTIGSYLEDSSNLKGGYAKAVVIPDTIQETAEFLKEANKKKQSVTISGAGTGQSGARIPFGDLVLSTEKLNTIHSIKRTGNQGVALLGPGVLIDDLKRECKRHHLFYAYDPTEQTAFIGGTIATNASGARSFRYGSTRKFVNALTIVLASGDLLKLKRGQIKAKKRTVEFSLGKTRYLIELPSYEMPDTKNSAGYYVKDNMDLIDLFIGQEGTLGVIVESEVELIEEPKGFFSCFVFFKEEKEAWDFSEFAKKERPLSIEYFDSNCLGLLHEKYGNVPQGKKAAVFFEDEIVKDEDSLVEKWDNALSEKGISLDDTWVAMNKKAQRDFLEKRHYIPEQMSENAKRSGFPKVSTDLAVPHKRFQEMAFYYDKTLKESKLKHYVFGHIGNAHLHVNILPSSEGGYKTAKKIQLNLIKKSISLGGTISAEHGIGKTKKEFLKLLYGEKGIQEMIRVKKALDPNLILGRGNIFDI